jgi:hypothetical protein
LKSRGIKYIIFTKPLNEFSILPGITLTGFIISKSYAHKKSPASKKGNEAFLIGSFVNEQRFIG